MIYGLVFKILFTVSVAFALIGMVVPSRLQRVWKTCYAISVTAIALQSLAFIWMRP